MISSLLSTDTGCRYNRVSVIGFAFYDDDWLAFWRITVFGTFSDS
jgi:hypothetical protein